MEALETAQGHPFGVSKHLQIQELLERLPDDTSEAYFEKKLPLLLAPLFAKNDQEQMAFYDLYADCLERVKAVHEAMPVTDAVEQKEERKWKGLIAGLVALTLLLAAPFIAQWLEAEKYSDEEHFYQTLERNVETVICPDTSKIADWDSIVNAAFCDQPADTLRTQLGTYVLTGEGCMKANMHGIGKDSICMSATAGEGQHVRLIFHPTVDPQDSIEIAATRRDTVQKAKKYLFTQKDSLPHKTDIRKLEVHPPKGLTKFIIDNEWLLKIAFLLALAALLWAILRWRDFRRRKLIAEVESRDKPPYFWNINIEGLEQPEMNDAYYAALHRLRQRTADEHSFLDIDATIKATIEEGGFTAFRYGQHTRPPEYLLLIDRQSAANHRAQLFDGLYQTFKANEVLVERFFFDGDIRLCYNEAFPHGVSLQGLLHKYHRSRLLVVGNGYQLLSPLSGQLSKWTAIFTQWKQRSLLSTSPTNTWGQREEHLQELFNVLPASLQGLHFLVDQLDAGEDADFSQWQQKIQDAPSEPIEMRGGLIATLQSYFSEDLLRWIAACVIYPSLHYDLTLYIGSLLSTENNNLLTVGNIAELTRLSWFVGGRIPPEARMVLLGYLEEEHSATLLHVREGLHRLLQKNHPPEDSSAYEDYRMSVALNEWLFTKDEKWKKELEQEIASLLDQGVEADFTVVKYLDRERSPLDFVVPDAWKKYVYKGSHRGLGWKEAVKDLLWAVPLWFLVLGAVLWWQPTVEQCEGSKVNYKEMILCIDSEEDQLLYLEFLARDTIKAGDLKGLDSLQHSFAFLLDDLGLKDSIRRIYNENISISLYNKGVSLYNKSIENFAAFNLDNQLDLKDSICDYFSRAKTMISKFDEINHAYIVLCEKQQIFHPKQDYNLLKNEVAQQRKQFQLDYNNENSPENHNKIISSARKYLYQVVVNQILPHWYGTDFAYPSNHTNVPQEGSTTSSYLISTILRHADFNLNRYQIAQARSADLVSTLSLGNFEIGQKEIEPFVSYIQENLSEGLYTIGLEQYSGLILKKEGAVYFIHASKNYPNVVLIEKAITSKILKESVNSPFWLGDLLNNDQLILKWITDSPIELIPAESIENPKLT